MFKKRLRLLNALSLTIVLLVLFSTPGSVTAAAGIELSTTYPGITAGPGELLTIPLQIHNRNAQSRIVELALSSSPEGWEASLEGQGRKINQVFLKGESGERADLKIQVPEEAAEEAYAVAVSVSLNGQVVDKLTLNINVSRQTSGKDKLKAQYSELKGPADATFVFKVGLTNTGTDEQGYSLGADAPQGWQVSFKPSHEQQQVASISLDGGETKNLEVNIVPAPAVEAGEYTIPVYATSTTGQAMEELKVIISGTYQLILTTPSGRLNTDVVAGRDKKITLEVKNEGSAPLHEISFSAQTPNQWSVSFDPDTIAALDPGESRQVTATITAASKAIAGDYVVAINASAQEKTSQEEFRVTVKTSTLWGLTGVIIVILVIAGVYHVFQKYGRR